MRMTPRDVAGFLALPVFLRSHLANSDDIKHYIYLKAHDPQIADENASRSLFLVNVPVTTTEQLLKRLFTEQLGAGRVEEVNFSENAPGRTSIAAGRTSRTRKRKRVRKEDIESGLERYHLPHLHSSEIQVSGATAIVVFVDKASMELSLKAARKAADLESEIIWGGGMESKAPVRGLRRYQQANELRFPSRRELLRCVDGYMTAYGKMEEAKSREHAKQRQVPDEDGFVTVTRGTKGGIRRGEAQELAEKQKTKTGVEDFYRFQMRERRKDQQNQMLRKFEDDKRTVEEMRRRRGNLRPE